MIAIFSLFPAELQNYWLAQKLDLDVMIIDRPVGMPLVWAEQKHDQWPTVQDGVAYKLLVSIPKHTTVSYSDFVSGSQQYTFLFIYLFIYFFCQWFKEETQIPVLLTLCKGDN